MRVFLWLCYAIILAACTGSFGDDAALDDCDVRARAAGGEYVANVQVCLQDRHHLNQTGARQLAWGYNAWREAVGADDSTVRAANFNLYASYLRLARFYGADSGWVEQRISKDSLRLLKLP